MIPAKFDYVTPGTLDEAVALLEQHGDDAKILTGGHSLIPMLKMRLAQPAVVVDLREVDGLSGIRATADGLEIGAATTHAEIADSPDVPALLSETALEIGDPQVRNAGTLGGSLIHADPAADWPAAMLALRATIVLRGPAGERTVAARDFFRGVFESAADPAEILTAVRIPKSGGGGAYAKVAQSASGFAIAGVAAQVTLAGDSIAEARLGVTGVAECAFCPAAVEAALAGCATDETSIEAACASVTEGIELLEDIHASGPYRAHLAAVLAKRAVVAAVERAR